MPNISHRTSALSSLTQRLAERVNNSQSTHAKKILGLLERMEDQALALEKVKQARNPLDTDAAHSRKVAKAAERLQSASTPIYNQICELMVAGLRETEAAIIEKTGLVETQYSAEIRAAFRGMTEKQRSDTILTAMKEGNSEVIAAVCCCPAILSGVNAEAQQRYIESIRQTKAPELLQESEDISEAYGTADAVRQVAQKLYDESYDFAEQTAINQAETEASVAELMLRTSIEAPMQSS